MLDNENHKQEFVRINWDEFDTLRWYNEILLTDEEVTTWAQLPKEFGGHAPNPAYKDDERCCSWGEPNK